LFGPN
jgi:hypothetical protein